MSDIEQIRMALEDAQTRCGPMDVVDEGHAWVEVWSDTSLGRGIGGQAMTAAWTVVVTSSDAGLILLYVGGQARQQADWTIERAKAALAQNTTEGARKAMRS